MKIRHVKSFITGAAGLALIVIFMAAGALAQTIDTRLGKLNFERGFPTEETTRKLFDEMDYQRAVQAYFGLIRRFRSSLFASRPTATSALIWAT